MRTDKEYWLQVSTLPIKQIQAGASENYRLQNVVDWESVLDGTTEQSATFQLGWDPIDNRMVNGEAQWWTAEQLWRANLISRFENIESRLDKLEGK